MKPEDQTLPETLAPPLSPDATFDADVAAAFGVDRLAPASLVRKD
ncbi:hypothetical protein [Phreatobacter sp.]|nr:hypothetical protein [Phreatobacter sp.]